MGEEVGGSADKELLVDLGKLTSDGDAGDLECLELLKQL